MNAILFGFKGCGKTHFGKLLAQELKRPFIDTDQLIEERYQLKCKDVYQKLGETEFRLLETKVVASLEGLQNSVIALGGGAILRPQNLQILQKMGTLIYLETSLEIIQLRIKDYKVGPLETLYQERLPLYRAIAAPRIQTDLLNEAEIISNLCSIMEKTYVL